MSHFENPKSCMKEDGLHLGPASTISRNSEQGLLGDLEDLVEALRIVLDNVYSGIIVVDKDSKILYMNRFYSDLLKTDREEALGKHIKEFFPESRLPGILRSGEMELGQRCSLRAGIALLVNRIPIKRQGETIGVILQTIFKDYTEISELMARLNMLEKEVKYYKRGLDSMLSATFTLGDIVGSNRKILEARSVAEKYARTDAAVLITGATGTGKELFAHAVHTSSQRKKGPFVCVNCAAIPKELLESELFGYETGAFTGARQKGKPGKIELAHKGTLFLDEIGDLPMSAQSKILRVLETRKIEKLGGVRTQDVNFRLVAATNRDLRAMIGRNEFREDLYYRLNTMTIEVPSLAERADDIPALVDHFLRIAGRPAVKISEAAMDAILNYSWPGNVRELKNAIDRAMSLAEGNSIEIDHLPYEIRDYHNKCRRGRGTSVKPLAEELACHEKELITETLRLTRGNMVRAAKLLGISRSTLYEKCKAHGF
ncbi:MAG: sigma-54-dependent Fis family transcriptional regulator [Deltaproteobacteria bacterium HGW-Deltaproteobacteria-15]|nr:MAG: sigma-54-dependent Fis family transcriptional regulator [Deltaproteobacteria bacterium HGW-Deltaproteobacteria-15]